MGVGCGVAETAVASTVLPVHIIAALPNTIILVVADADAVVAAHGDAPACRVVGVLAVM